MAEDSNRSTSTSPPQGKSIRIPTPAIALIAAVLIFWGLARIVPDILAYAYGHAIDATVTRVVTWRRMMEIEFEVRTSEHDLVRGTDRLVMPYPPAVGERIEVAYLAVGQWRHAIVLSRRNWADAVFFRAVALTVGGMLCLCLASRHREEQRAPTSAPSQAATG